MSSTVFFTGVEVLHNGEQWLVTLDNGDAVSIINYPSPYQGGPEWESAYIPAGDNSGDWDIRKWWTTDTRSRSHAFWKHLKALGLAPEGVE